MKFTASLASIDAIKSDLRRAMPEVKSSHRAEALARGLGWNTNAAMRAALLGSVREQVVLPEAFSEYLAAHGFRTSDGCLRAAILRQQIGAVMAAHTELTHHGFGVYEDDRICLAVWRERYARSRAQMLEPAALGEFELACEFLSRLAKTRAPTKILSSYKLKHCAERWHRHRGADPDYVSNGIRNAADRCLSPRASSTSRITLGIYRIFERLHRFRQILGGRTKAPPSAA